MYEEILIRIDENVKFIKNEAIPELKVWQKDHDEKDDGRFAEINTTLARGDGAVRTLKWVFGGLCLIVLAFITAFFAHVMGGH